MLQGPFHRKSGLCGVALIAGMTLGVSTQSARAALNLLTDAGFDDHQGNIPSHNVRPSGQGGWIWAGSAGIDTGNPYGSSASNCTAFDGNTSTGTFQMGYIQGAGAGGGLSVAAQNISLIVGQTYKVDFEAKAIAGFSGVDPIFVSIFDNGSLAAPLFGGAALSPSTNGPDTNGYTHYTAAFSATDTTEQLDIYDAGNQPVPTVTWVDAVSVTAVPEPVSVGMLAMGVLVLLRRRRGIVAGI